MLREERHRYILNRLTQDHRVHLTNLSKDLDVSTDTIRRDLEELDRVGLLKKVHGGAVPKSGIPATIVNRSEANNDEKNHLASKAITLFKPGDLILIDGGTTNIALARQLPKDTPFTVFTNSFPTVNALLDHSLVDLVFLGGGVSKTAQTTVGIAVFQALQNIRVDWLVLGVSHVHPQRGLTTSNREEALLKKQMIDQARKVVILVDNHKLNTAETYNVASLQKVDVVVVETDQAYSIQKDWPSYWFTLL